MCQESMHVFNQIPFNMADYRLFNWNDLASRIEEGYGDGYTPTYPMYSIDF